MYTLFFEQQGYGAQQLLGLCRPKQRVGVVGATWPDGFKVALRRRQVVTCLLQRYTNIKALRHPAPPLPSSTAHPKGGCTARPCSARRSGRCPRGKNQPR